MSNRITKELTGVLAAVTTPFTADGSAIDEQNLRGQVERLIAGGIHGIVPTGTSGEFLSLSDDEYRRVIELYVQAAAGRIPVVAGIGAMTNAKAIELAQHAERVGADAIMLVPPFYDPMTFENLKAFLADVAASINLSIVYYNVPGATGIQLSAEQIAELGEIEGLDYLKNTSDDAVGLTELLVKHTDKIKAFNGWDTLTFLGISLGAQASVWGAAGVVPGLAAEFWQTLAVEKDLAKAREQWKILWEISDFLESVPYPAGLKAGLELIGHPAGPVRAPLREISAEEKSRFAQILAKAGVLPVTA
ncbi:dihydrodipicolinate synthase family protein [Glutamicibacter sp. NPDC087344]|uniref:dihydrodipicolinate synthase family protein n=1 Tax=Glutamicibacter sp. NPDC087344 TaxID=3363994 RepID=UPI0037F92330